MLIHLVAFRKYSDLAERSPYVLKRDTELKHHLIARDQELAVSHTALPMTFSIQLRLKMRVSIMLNPEITIPMFK